MIPIDEITEWRSIVKWVSTNMVEQDLVISRALIELYSNDYLKQKLAFRGGTALNKLFFSESLRYSEDLDFIQTEPDNIGHTLDEIRNILDIWLGVPKREVKEGLVKLIYRFQSSNETPLKLKVEINTKEHYLSKKLHFIPFSITSRWFTGTANITTLNTAWLVASKLKALYQRKKGRDLFDLFVVLNQNLVSATSIIEAFLEILKLQKVNISRAEFEKNLYDKMRSSIFTEDITPLLSPDYFFDFSKAYEFILENLIALIPGAPWKKLNNKYLR